MSSSVLVLERRKPNAGRTWEFNRPSSGNGIVVVADVDSLMNEVQRSLPRP
jgi:hypothetical protein